MADTETVKDRTTEGQKVIVFICNWKAYSGLEAAGAEQLRYSPAVLPIRVTCLGELSPGILLKAFEKGAHGVLMLGCPPGECQYTFGNRCAEDVLTGTRELIALLGYRQEQLQIDWIGAGQGQAFVAKVDQFIASLNGNQGK